MFKLFYQLSESNNFEALIVLLEALTSGTMLASLVVQDLSNAVWFAGANEEDQVQQVLSSCSDSPTESLRSLFLTLMVEENYQLEEDIKSLVDEARTMSSLLPAELMRDVIVSLSTSTSPIARLLQRSHFQRFDDSKCWAQDGEPTSLGNDMNAGAAAPRHSTFDELRRSIEREKLLLGTQGSTDLQSSASLKVMPSQLAREEGKESFIRFEDMQKTLAFELWGIGEGSTRLLEVLQASHVSNNAAVSDSPSSCDVSLDASSRLDSLSFISRSNLLPSSQEQPPRTGGRASDLEGEDVEGMLLQTQGEGRDSQQEAFHAHVKRIGEAVKPKHHVQTRVRALSNGGNKMMPEYLSRRSTSRAHGLSQLHRSCSPTSDAEKENRKQLEAARTVTSSSSHSKSPSRLPKKLQKAQSIANKSEASASRQRLEDKKAQGSRRPQSSSANTRDMKTGSRHPAKDNSKKSKTENSSPWILMQLQEGGSAASIDAVEDVDGLPAGPPPGLSSTSRRTSKRSIVERCEWLQQEWAILILQASIRRALANNAARAEQQRAHGRAARWTSNRGKRGEQEVPAEVKVSAGREKKLPLRAVPFEDVNRRRAAREKVAVKRQGKAASKSPALWVPFNLGDRPSARRENLAEESGALSFLYTSQSTLLSGSSLRSLLPLQSLETSSEEDLNSLGDLSGFRVLMSRGRGAGGGGVVRTCMRLKMMRKAFVSWAESRSVKGETMRLY